MKGNRLPLLTAGALVVATLWTVLTEQWLHWLPVLGAIAIVYGMVRSTEK